MEYMFTHSISCKKFVLKVCTSYASMMARLHENCKYDVSVPVEHCNEDEYQEECRPYRAVRGENIIMKNEACLACKMKGNSSTITTSPPRCSGHRYRSPSIINLFQFIASQPRPRPKDCPEWYATGTPGNLCLMKKCPPGFNLYDTQCIPHNCSISHFEPLENIYSTVYNIADFFRSALLVMFKRWDRHSHSLDDINNKTISILKDWQPCSLTQAHTYQHFAEGA